ncbi:type VII secretion protein EsaA, partial [Bacillus mobilis]
EVKESLAKDGITFSDTAKVIGMDSSQTMNITIPSGFELYGSTDSLLIDGVDRTSEFKQNGSIVISARNEGDLKISLHVKLIDPSINIDVFSPVTWEWKLNGNYEKETSTGKEEPKKEEPNKENEGTKTENSKVENVVNQTQYGIMPLVNTVKKPIIQKTEQSNNNPEGGTGTDNGGNPGGGTGTDNGGNPGGGTGTDNGGNPGGGTGTDNGGNPGGGTGTDNGGNQNQGGGSTVIERTNNYIVHQKTEKLTDNTSNVLIKEAVETVQSYQGLLSLYQMYYGIDLRTNDVGPKLEEGSLDTIATDHSLYYMLNKQSVIDLISNLVSASITSEVKQDMTGLKQKIDAYQQLITSADQNSMLLAEKLNETMQQATSMNQNLGEYLKGLAKWRESSLKLVEEQQVLTTNNAGEQTAVLSLDSGIKSLTMQTQSLVESSKHSLATSDDVYKTFDQINGQAKEIQESGTTIVSKADSLLNDFTKKMEDDKAFSKNFTKILANSRIGDRQNEMLYEFLSSPVQKQNDGVIVAGNAFTPYLIVLTCFIVALFTAYAIANQEKKRTQSDHFEERFSLIDMNVPTTVVAFGISIVEGISIGVISGRLLKFGQDQSLLWIAFITIIMMAFVLVSTYLLRQIKMVGMFILLVFLSMYLFLTEAVGSKVDQMSSVGKLRQFSPLQYIEGFLNDFISGKDTGKVIFIVLFVIAIIGLVSNLFVWHKKWEEKEVNDQKMEHSG